MRAMQALFVVGAVASVTATQYQRLVQAEPAARENTGQPPTKREIDPRADKLLRQMSTELGNMKSFRFTTSQVMEVVEKDGEKIQGLAGSTVTVQRPNKLRVDRMGPFGGGSLYYDGTNLTFYGKRDNLYATAKAPDNLDATIDFAREQLSIDAPGADLLFRDPYTVLMADTVSGRYMGKEPIGNRMCHHLAYRGTDTDWQIWIEDGPHALPCRFVITSKKVIGSPEYTVSMYDWQVERELPASEFAFTPPQGAKQINFIAISQEVARKKQAKR